MNTITTVGIDLAKSTFSLHGVDAHGKTVLRKTLSRNKLLPFMAQLPPCLVGMEACSGAHHWARELQSLSVGLRHEAQHFQQFSDHLSGFLRQPDLRELELPKPSDVRCMGLQLPPMPRLVRRYMVEAAALCE